MAYYNQLSPEGKKIARPHLILGTLFMVIALVAFLIGYFSDGWLFWGPMAVACVFGLWGLWQLKILSVMLADGEEEDGDEDGDGEEA
ncbi:MAG: hypothetical protein J5871_03210 [Bacteroidales bacterium]|nr:hypothetical protein [Bacteroidales bacterium]